MKKILVLISAFFILFSATVNSAYTGTQVYNGIQYSFDWIEDNVSPLGDTDSVASDYYVMALRRCGKLFDYNKYIKITEAKVPATFQDAHRVIMANTASGGFLPKDFIAENTYHCELTRAADKATAIISLLSGEYKIDSEYTDIDRMIVDLVSMQNADGSFEADVVSTAKSIIALSFASGKAYVLKGKQPGEKYRYDINMSILRGVNWLQNNTGQDFGFGSVKNTAYVIMALDAAGVDADKDPGFSNKDISTFGSLMASRNADGSFGTYSDDTAIAVCAMVSHLRAMQGNSMFFALRTEDMPYNPADYIEDINRSGEGLKVKTQEEIEVDYKDTHIESVPTEKPFKVNAQTIPEPKPYSAERKSLRVWLIVVVLIAFLLVTAITTGVVVYIMYVRPQKKFHRKESEEGEDD